jgi:hypothetical protein
MTMQTISTVRRFSLGVAIILVSLSCTVSLAQNLDLPPVPPNLVSTFSSGPLLAPLPPVNRVAELESRSTRVEDPLRTNETYPTIADKLYSPNSDDEEHVNPSRKDCCTNDDFSLSNCGGGHSWGGYIYTYGESFRGPADGTFGGNGGGATGINLGRQLGGSAWGVQLGGSYGTYDWRGRSSGNEAAIMQSQLFFTGGIYRNASCDSPVSFGLLYDMMVNDNFGSASHEPFLTQFRIQTGYALNQRNEIGFWTALADRNAQQGSPAVSYRAVNTYNLYLNHKFCSGAQSNSWIGAAQQSRIGPPGNLAPVAGTGSLYTLVLGNYTIIPITCRLSGYTSVMYGFPSASNGVAAALDETYSIQAGMIFYPRRNSRNRSVSGAAWMPYMPVANNGTLLVDANGAP